eukprot:2031884-Rhodomonas_salina.1
MHAHALAPTLCIGVEFRVDGQPELRARAHIDVEDAKRDVKVACAVRRDPHALAGRLVDDELCLTRGEARRVTGHPARVSRQDPAHSPWITHLQNH